MYYIVVDEVEVVTRRDSHRASTAACNTSICLMQSLMYVDKRRYDCVTMTQRQRNVVTDRYDIGRRQVLRTCNNNNNNSRISIAPYGRNLRGAGGRSDQCSVKA